MLLKQEIENIEYAHSYVSSPTYTVLAYQLRSDKFMPFLPPQGPPGFPGFPGQLGMPSGQPGQIGAPSSPPPGFIPQQPAVSPFAVDPEAIVRCLFRNTYVWLVNRNQFWFYPVFVGRTSVAGFQWNGRFWVYTGLSLQSIQSFTCF